ncbi:MAG: hypothetical protein E6Q92_08730 [Burkholderiaceae bacterium]|nr:MAG: hypothetical protein E6Q92_08730 [Burkholderiaceae bacterium]
MLPYQVCQWRAGRRLPKIRSSTLSCPHPRATTSRQDTIMTLFFLSPAAPGFKTSRATRIAAAVALSLTLALAGCGKDMDLHDDFLIRKVAEAQALQQMAPQEAVSLRMANGDVLEGVFLKQTDARASVLFIGGNAQSVQGNLPALREYARRQNVNLLSMNYRGYAFSQGQSHMVGLGHDAQEWLQWLKAQPETAGRPVVIHGLSMGSLTTGAMLGETDAQVDAVILESTASSIGQWVNGQVPWYGKPMVNIRLGDYVKQYDNRRNVQRFQGPLLVITGGRDELTPSEMSKAVFDASPSPSKRFLKIEEGGHVGLWHKPVYMQTLDVFLGGLSKGRAAAPVAALPSPAVLAGAQVSSPGQEDSGR